MGFDVLLLRPQLIPVVQWAIEQSRECPRMQVSLKIQINPQTDNYRVALEARMASFLSRDTGAPVKAQHRVKSSPFSNVPHRMKTAGNIVDWILGVCGDRFAEGSRSVEIEFPFACGCVTGRIIELSQEHVPPEKVFSDYRSPKVYFSRNSET